MRLDYQCSDRCSGQCRTLAQFMGAKNQQGASEQPRLRMRCRDHCTGIRDYQRPQARECPQARPCPQSPCRGDPGDPCDRKWQCPEWHRREKERGWINEREPPIAAGASLHLLLNREIVCCRRIASGCHMARTPECQKIRTDRAHCLKVCVTHQCKARQRNQPCIAAHPVPREPFGFAQPIHFCLSGFGCDPAVDLRFQYRHGEASSA